MSKKLILHFLLCWLCAGVYAQNYEAINTDELFKIAREKAFDGDRQEARKICLIILNRSPKYHEVRVLYGRTFAWSGKREEARTVFKKVLDEVPGFLDAILALIDLELWDDHPEQAEIEVNKGLEFYPGNEDLLIRKVKVLRDQEKYAEALEVLSRIETLNPSCSECSPLRQDIRARSFKHAVDASYTVDHFSDVFDPMHYIFIQGSTKTTYGPVTGRLNYSHRSGLNGIQPEIDFYPKIYNGVYAYLNYGFSTSSLYPENRVGAEIYFRLPAGFEASGGIRYMGFGGNDNILFYTVTLTKYYRNLMFTLRPYFASENGTFSNSFSVMTRKYFGNADNYMSINLGTGFSPDQKRLLTNTGLGEQNNIYFLRSQKIAFMFQKSLKLNVLMTGGLDYIHQELSFSYGNYVNIFSVNAGIKVKL